MATRMRCVVPLYDRAAARRIVAVEDQRSVATAQALDWPGVLLEASGGVHITTVRDIAATGVDRISVGELTHSASALDIGLDYAQ